MTLPDKENFPQNDTPLRSTARRRRRKRPSLFGRADERNIFLGNLTHAATPAANYYSLSILTGIILGFALFFNLRSLYVLAALAAPFMAPLAGLSIATVSGSIRFFFHSLGALLIGAILVFGLGALSSVAGGIWPELSQLGSPEMIGFTWADIVLLLTGTILMAVQLYRNPTQNPRLASAALAFEITLPAALAGYGLATGNTAYLQNGLIHFAFNASLAYIIGAVVFVILGLRLRLHENYSLGGSVLLAGIACFIILFGYQFIATPAVMKTSDAPFIAATQTIAVMPTITATDLILTPTTLAPSQTKQPTKTITSTQTPVSTLTSTATITPEPKPYLAVVRVSSAQGAYIREEPAGAVVNSILNGMWVEIQPQYEEVVVNDAAWVFISTDDGIEGWIMKSLLDIRATTPQP